TCPTFTTVTGIEMKCQRPVVKDLRLLLSFSARCACTKADPGPAHLSPFSAESPRAAIPSDPTGFGPPPDGALRAQRGTAPPEDTGATLGKRVGARSEPGSSARRQSPGTSGLRENVRRRIARATG